MLLALRNKAASSLISRASYYSLQSSGLKFERESRTQEAIFPGFDHLVVPNIYTCKPKPGQDAIDLHDDQWFTQQLKDHGHIILKNTGIQEPKEFQRWSRKFWKKQWNYDGGLTPRDDIGDGVLNVNTFEPPMMDLTPHVEVASHNFFPGRVAFCCFKQAEVGGITTLADNRKISKYTPDNLKEKLMTHGQYLHTIYQNKNAYEQGKEEEKWYNNWQDSFRVKTKEEAIEFLEKEKFSYQFYGKNDWVRVWVKTEAYHYHEGDLYFVHQLDVSDKTYFQLVKEFNKYPQHKRPYYVIWGNGEDITPDEMYQFAFLNSKYQVNVTYEPGDIFLMDNIKFKHGRTPFIGSRRIGALMGDRVNRKLKP